MWTHVAGVIGGKTWKQCEQRYKTILKRKKLSIDNNNKSGSKRTLVEYEEELRKIARVDDSIEPEIQTSSQKTIKKIDNISAQQENKAIKNNKLKTKTVTETLLEIHEKKKLVKKNAIVKKWKRLKKWRYYYKNYWTKKNSIVTL